MLSFDFTQFNKESFVKNFNEDSVWESIVYPLLQEMGFIAQTNNTLMSNFSKESKLLECTQSPSPTQSGRDSKSHTFANLNKIIAINDLITPPPPAVMDYM